MRRLAREMPVGRVALFLPLTAILIGMRMPIRDNSFLWHIRAGTLQRDYGAVLTTDPFSFTASGEPWRTQSWLLELVYATFDSSRDPHLVGAWVVGISAMVLLGGVALRAYRQVRSPLVAAIVTIVTMWVSLGWFTPRPIVASMALFSMLVLVVDYRYLRWTIPLIIWVWASVHGGFVVGLGYLVLDFLRRPQRQRLVGILVGSAVASLTAHGLGVWQILLEFLGNQPALDTIVEWAVPDLFDLALVPFLGVIASLIVSARRGRLSGRDQWVVLPFLFFAFSASRAVPLSAIVLSPWLAVSLEPLVARIRSSRGNYVTLALSVAIIAVPLLLPIEGGLDETSFPLEASRHLTQDRVFHEDGTGGYLIFAQYPSRRVYIDDRAELYGDRFVEFGEIRSAKADWREPFRVWGIRQALLRHEAPLVRLLTAANWASVYEDEHFVVLNAPALN